MGAAPQGIAGRFTLSRSRVEYAEVAAAETGSAGARAVRSTIRRLLSVVMSRPEPELPSYRDLLYPTLQVIEANAGSAPNSEINRDVIAALAITEEQMGVDYPEGSSARGSKVKHRLAFARSSLKAFDAVDNAEQGVWTITPTGRRLLEDGDEEVRAADSEARRQLRLRRAENRQDVAPTRPEEVAADEDEEVSAAASADRWKSDLLETIWALTPQAFERLCARVLYASGCEDVEVTGRAGDQGVDGEAKVRTGLLRVSVVFQAKRYDPSKAIGPDKVRELRGAVAGRADHGILITTARFSTAASTEAERGGMRIELIDGEDLCDLLRSHHLGVEDRPTVVAEFFDSL